MKKQRRFLSLMLTMAMLVGGVLTCHAAETTTIDSTSESNPAAETAITATVQDSYIIALPKTIALTKASEAGGVGTYKGASTVAVKANVTKNKYLELKPTTTTVMLTDTEDATNTVTATVTQTKQEWSTNDTISGGAAGLAADLTKYVSADIAVSADIRDRKSVV